MSSIFSDPQFRRGTTLLDGQVELDDSGNPVAGSDVVGTVKAFIDEDPHSRGGEKLSSRLVYCVAARWKGADHEEASTIAGSVFTFLPAACLTEIGADVTDKGKSVSADVNAGKAVGVLDEYLNGRLKKNDVVWVVVKGPAKVASTGTINAGAMAFHSATAGTAGSTGSTVALGQAISAAAGSKVRVNLYSDAI